MNDLDDKHHNTHKNTYRSMEYIEEGEKISITNIRITSKLQAQIAGFQINYNRRGTLLIKTLDLFLSSN
jgi:hypothetical protein